MKVYTSYNKDRPITLKEKGRTTSFHAIITEHIPEIELISNIINTSWIQFLSLLDIVLNKKHDKYIDSHNFDRLKRSVFGTVFDWLFGGLGGTDQNVEQLKNNVDILKANQNIQQKQIKEIFKLNYLTRVEATPNRRILRQLDVKLISLNHSMYKLQVEMGKLQTDRNFILSMLRIQSQLSTLLVGIIQLNKDLEEVIQLYDHFKF